MNNATVGVSVMSLHYGSSLDVFRRNCLLFEKIILARVNEGVEVLRKRSHMAEDGLSDGLALMLEKGIVVDAPDYSSDENLKKLEDIATGVNRTPEDLKKYIELDQISNERQHFHHVAETLRSQIENASRDSRGVFSSAASVQKRLSELLNEQMRYYWASCLAEARHLNAMMRLFDDADSVSMESFPAIGGDRSVPEDEVLLQLCLERFPIPARHVPLDSLLALREEVDWSKRISRIRVAIGETGSGRMPARHTGHEISELAYELETIMTAGGLAAESAKLSALVAISDEILEEVVNSKVESAVQSLVQLSGKPASVTKQEASVSGRLLSLSVVEESSG